MKQTLQRISWLLPAACTVIVLALLLITIWDIFSNGLAVISWNFIFDFPSEGMTKGGILPAVIGTFLLTIIATLFSVPLGIACAIYLNEYARNTGLTRLIRASIRNLAGIPSIIYGLFGLALFVQSFRFGTSLISAGLTLGLLSLPYIITTTEEALKRVPLSIREGTLAIGATHFETIKDIVVPSALPGILT